MIFTVLLSIIGGITFTNASHQYYQVSTGQPTFFQFSTFQPYSIQPQFRTPIYIPPISTYTFPQRPNLQVTPPEYRGFAYQTNANGATSHVVFVTGPQSQAFFRRNDRPNAARSIASNMLDPFGKLPTKQTYETTNPFQFFQSNFNTHGLINFYSNQDRFYRSDTTFKWNEPTEKAVNDIETKGNELAQESVVTNTRFKINGVTSEEKIETTTLKAVELVKKSLDVTSTTTIQPNVEESTTIKLAELQETKENETTKTLNTTVNTELKENVTTEYFTTDFTNETTTDKA